MIIKRNKFSRERGNKTHGWGHKKKHRGKGSRGGKGNAGSGKRSDSKKPSTWKNLKQFGKYGFFSHNKKVKAITLRDLNKKYDGKVDLTKEGYGKIIGTGQITKKFEITVQTCTKKAEEKIKKAGGKVIFQEKKEKKEATKPEITEKKTSETQTNSKESKEE